MEILSYWRPRERLRWSPPWSPARARAQQQATPVIGFLHSGSLGGTRNLLIALRKV
jgi:hypothetical protein